MLTLIPPVAHRIETGYHSYSALHSLLPTPDQVTLEDLYNGKVSKLAVQKNIICSDCKGIGGKEVCTCTVYIYIAG